MIDYQTFCEIRRMYDEENMSSNKIGKILGIDQKTASRWAKRKRFSKKITVQRNCVIHSFKERIDSLIKECPHYSAQQIFQIICEEDYKGSYSTVAHYVAKIKDRQKKAYLTLNFEPGEYAQVDFANCGSIKLNSTNRKIYAFIMVLCHSRMMYAEFIYHQNQENFLQCHRNAFEYFGGIPKNIMVDNCKVAVLEHSRYGSVKLNPHYLDFAYHYAFNIKACGVRKPHEKGQVEKAVDYLKGNFLRGRSNITDIGSLNSICRYWLDNMANCRVHKTTRKRPVDMLQKEKELLGDINILPYDCSTIKTVRANSQFRVIFDTNRYSVPADFASSVLTAKIYPEKLLFYHDNSLIAEHKRSYERHMDFENPEHVRKLLEHKRNAREQKMICSFLAITAKAPDYYTGLKEKRFNSKDHVRKILTLCDRYGRKKTASALEDALELGAFSSEYIANLLEQRERFTPAESPLHLLRNRDCLDIELKPTNMNVYTSLEKDNKNAKKL